MGGKFFELGLFWRKIFVGCFFDEKFNGGIFLGVGF